MQHYLIKFFVDRDIETPLEVMRAALSQAELSTGEDAHFYWDVNPTVVADYRDVAPESYIAFHMAHMMAIALRTGLDVNTLAFDDMRVTAITLPHGGGRGVIVAVPRSTSPATRNTALRARCDGCGEALAGKIGRLPRLVTLLPDGRILVRVFCRRSTESPSSDPCWQAFVDELNAKGTCVWCGKSVETAEARVGGLGEPYCCGDCYGEAGRAMFEFEMKQDQV